MTNQSFSSLEATFLSKFNEGFKTFDSLKENVPFNEKTLKSIIETMMAKNIIKFDNIKKEYIYESPIKGDKIILDGNIMLPVTIIKFTDKIYVTRGEWYVFPIDFDIRRIIWNVNLPNKTNSTLVDLLKEAVLKEKRSKIIQVEEYKQLVNKIIPYSSKLNLKIITVGETQTDVLIIFKDKLFIDNTKEDFIEFKGFTVRSEIKTEELIKQLTCPVAERKFSSIELNKIFNFSDFIFSGNEIPYSSDEESISYIKLTGIKGRIELTYFMLENTGIINKLTKEEYLDTNEGIEKIRELFTNYAQNLIIQSDILVELTD